MARRQAAILIICAGLLYGCPEVDHIPIRNNSEFKMDIFMNDAFPDTSFINSQLNTYVEPGQQRGRIKVVNRRWRDYLEGQGTVTIFFAEWSPNEIQFGPNYGRPTGRQAVYGKITLTLARLDSLGWEIKFPEDVVPVPEGM